MKILIPFVLALFVLGCDKGNQSASPESKSGSTESTSGSTESTSGSTESTSALPENQLIGYWTVDEEKSLKALESLPESSDSREEQQFKERISQAAKGMFLNFSKSGKVVGYFFDNPSEDLTYTIVSEDEEALSVKVEQIGNFLMKGDTLQMIPPKGEPESMKCILWSRIDAEEAQRYIEEAQSTKSIHRAAEQGDLESLKKHIAAGGDINAQGGRDGETPLHRAITRGQTEAAKLLIDSGCDLNIGRKKDGETPLDMAEGRGRTEIAALLREKGAKKSAKEAPSADNDEGRGVPDIGEGNQPAISIHRAAEQGDLESLKKHIAAGADINAQDGRDGETPLHRAITRGQTEAAKLLIESGCDLNIGRTKDGDTPLDMAEGRGRTEIAALLREKGAKKSSGLPAIK